MVWWSYISVANNIITSSTSIYFTLVKRSASEIEKRIVALAFREVIIGMTMRIPTFSRTSLSHRTERRQETGLCLLNKSSHLRLQKQPCFQALAKEPFQKPFQTAVRSAKISSKKVCNNALIVRWCRKENVCMCVCCVCVCVPARYLWYEIWGHVWLLISFGRAETV